MFRLAGTLNDDLSYLECSICENLDLLSLINELSSEDKKRKETESTLSKGQI